MKEPRKYVPINAWPQDDQVLWKRLQKPKSPFDEYEKTLDWSASTWRWTEQTYGRWIGWIRENDPASLRMPPEDRIVQFRIAAFGKSLRDDVSLQTVENTVRGLKTVAINLFPNRDWQWLREICARLRKRTSGSRENDKPAPRLDHIFPALVADLGCQMLEGAESARAFWDFRDVLMVVILCSAPVRLKNLTEMEIGKNLNQCNRGWSLSFLPDETKTNTHLKYLIPDSTTRALEHYVNVLRKQQTTGASCNRLWITTKGLPMQYHSVYRRIISTTDRIFQCQINPHRFRTIVASHCRDQTECRPQSANAILGHRSDSIAGAHYFDGDLTLASHGVSSSLHSLD